MHILVMGLGVHGGGLGVARWLLRQGHTLTITDMANAAHLAEPLAHLAAAEREYGNPIRYVLGEHRAEDFATADMLVVNPAVPPTSPWLALARQYGLRIETEMTLFFRHCPAPIIGITGTKGKTTTTMLTGAIFGHANPDTVIAGNLRVSALEALDTIRADTPVVLELSSFQLVGLGEAGLSPRYACVTNLSPDHLNYHGTMAAYAAAKQQIFRHQDADGIVVLPPDLRADWADVLAASAGTVHTFSMETEPGADCTITAAGTVTWRDAPLMQRDEIQLPGAHNQANVLAAVALAASYGVPAATIRAAVREFSGVEHRLETVRVLNEVRYVNDTTATNPAAAQVALTSFAAPLVLLAGGANKALPDEAITAFAHQIAAHAKVLVLLEGTATPALHAAVQAATSEPMPILGPYDDFAAAIQAAQAAAAPGDVVLLSPGFASFGMFRNEFHRGEEFCRIVREL
jgi:UDP-N-acetylmuramoylalanine--D-glutamate ligase